MKTLCVIPARYGSTRLKGKMLLAIGGKPLIQCTWEHACGCRAVDAVAVAVDDMRVKKAAESFGARVFMTSRTHQSGTDRVAEVARRFYSSAKYVINLQGDEPLMTARNIARVIRALDEDLSCDIATLMIKIDVSQAQDPAVVKVATDARGRALYFSRAPIPYYRDQKHAQVFFKHLGIYAYRRAALFTFTRLRPSPLEKKEKLEQLRALENGMRITVVETTDDSIGVDTARDLAKVKKILRA